MTQLIVNRAAPPWLRIGADEDNRGSSAAREHIVDRDWSIELCEPRGPSTSVPSRPVCQHRQARPRQEFEQALRTSMYPKNGRTPLRLLRWAAWAAGVRTASGG